MTYIEELLIVLKIIVPFMLTMLALVWIAFCLVLGTFLFTYVIVEALL